MLTAIDYNTLFYNINIGIAAIEADGTLSMANKKLLQFLELPEHEFVGTSFLEWIYDADDRNQLRENHLKRIQGAQELPQSYDIRLKTKNGYLHVLASVTYFQKTGRSFISVLDTTQLKETRKQLEEIIHAQNAILAAIPDLMFELSRDGVYVNVWAHNPQELAATKEQLLGNSVTEILPPTAAQIVMATIDQTLQEGSSSGRQIEIQTPGGELWFELSASLKENNDAEPTVIMLSRNITARKELEFKLRYLSRHDSLTTLYNRRILEEILKRDIHRAQRYHTPLSVCMLDIDYFKQINDTYGHQMGDRVIKELAMLLKNSLREIDYAGRYGGEEFVIVLPETPLSHAHDFAIRLLKTIAALKFQSENQALFSITASIGIAELNEKNNSYEALIKAADNAMYLAKDTGRNCVKESLYKTD